jgi:hypothetical protein
LTEIYICFTAIPMLIPITPSRYSLLVDGRQRQMSGWVDGRQLFICDEGVRVVTDLGGEVVGVVGIAPRARSITLTTPTAQLVNHTVRPNTEWGVTTTSASSGGGGESRRQMAATLRRSAPFVPPFG